jgi:outer membrane protein TolC
MVVARLEPSRCAVFALSMAIIASGCLVGPDYKRPPVTQPDTLRGDDTAAPAAASIADEKWSQLFDDDVLQDLIRTALEHNDDLRIAAVRILEAQAQLGITHADEFPNVSAGVDVLGQRPSAALGFRRGTSSRPRFRRPRRGSWISGASSAAPPRAHARSCWRPSGDAARS